MRQKLVIIGPFKNRKILDVIPHDFVVIETPVGIFDSSIIEEDIRGIPFNFPKIYPDLGVGLLPKKPDHEDFLKEWNSSGKPLFALYSAETRRSIIAEKVLQWTSSTPFGEWLTEKFGSQAGLWGKATWFAAEVYAGRIPFEYIGLTRDTLWDRIAAIPDKDELILRKINSV